MTSITHRLARHAIETPLATMPQANLDIARLRMLGTLAVAWAGADAPGCQETHALLKFSRLPRVQDLHQMAGRCQFFSNIP